MHGNPQFQQCPSELKLRHYGTLNHAMNPATHKPNMKGSSQNRDDAFANSSTCLLNPKRTGTHTVHGAHAHTCHHIPSADPYRVLFLPVTLPLPEFLLR